MKKYTSAPLPFMGQKRRFLNEFKTALKDYPKDAIYVDLFGGSGLLSHTVKAFYPDAKVIYNDFDNYRERLDNIDKTNALITDLRVILKDWPKDKRITGDVRDKVIARIEAGSNSRLCRLYNFVKFYYVFNEVCHITKTDKDRRFV
nr:DNA adenine methylase [Flavobacterium covae]